MIKELVIIYDIHSHIIYGIDDGSKDENMSKRLLQIAAQSGTSHIVATPHVIELNNHPDWGRILDGVEKLKAIAVENNLDLKIYPGCELEMNWDMLKLFSKDSRDFCVNGSRYLLVELPAMTIPPYAEDFWYELEIKGIRPILAHAERYKLLMENHSRLLKWMNAGVLVQINGTSLLGNFGKSAQKSAENLLKNDCVHFIGSDAHRVEIRNTDLAASHQRLIELVGDAKAEQICQDNPKRMLADEHLEFSIPKKFIVGDKKQGFWSRLFG